MSRVLAVALLTLKEGLAPRTVGVLWALLAASLAGAVFLGDGESADDRLRLALSSGGQATHALLLLSAAVLGAFTHAQELRRRHHLLLFAKPIRKGSYLAGKCLGLWASLLVLAALFAGTSWLAVALAAGPGTALRAPLPPRGQEDGAWVFEAGPGEPPRALEIRLKLAEPPANLEALVSCDGTEPVRIALAVNPGGEGQTSLPEALRKPGVFRVRLPLPPQAVAEVRLVASSSRYGLLLARAALGDWLQAGTVAAAALAASTFLSAPVALFLATGLLCLGQGHELLRDLELLLQRSAERAAKGTPPDLTLPRTVAALRWTMPDLTQVDLCGDLDQAVLGRGLPLRGTLLCAAYAAGFLLAGMAAFSFRETG